GIEVLEDEKSADMREFALELIAKSARQASAKLQFARIAFGAASSAGAQIDLTDAAQVLRGFVEAEGKVSLDFKPSPALMDKSAVKLLFNMAMIAMNAIPRGGKMVIEADPVSNEISITSEGLNARIASGVAEIASGDIGEQGVDAHSIQPYYTSLLAEELGLRVAFTTENEVVRVKAGPAA
ncbi:MAG: histidine phosphotransferase, partial [Rhizobiaceae bacterium]|nr:histidine phosphotransferase [Rhizobiaceae bacterium]